MSTTANRREGRSLDSLSLVDHALGYARDGWAVLPVCRQKKAPFTKHGVCDATIDADTLRSWWKRWPSANIALAVPASDLVLDLDSEEALRRLKFEGRDLPATARARTSRGYHFWYRVPEPVGNRVKLREDMDIRGVGGYVVAPPSLHASGVRYRWDVHLERSAIADAPQWLLGLLRERESARGREPAEWLKKISEPVGKGRRNQTLAEVAGLLFHYLPAEVAAELASCWAQVKLRPPLPDSEVGRTIESIAGCELRNREAKR